MRYYQVGDPSDARLALHTDEGSYDLTAANASVESFGDLARAASIADREVDAIAAKLAESAPELASETIADTTRAPVHADEVWAAGVTYHISEQARQEESTMPDMYIDVYEGGRPEVFFKATPNRYVGPDEPVGIRSDSEWDVPEPELGVVLYQGDIVGFTVGNDMSSRSIEGENPLYLPQAKVYDRCCSIGPCVRSAASVDDPHDLEMWMTIRRDGETLYEESTDTGEMVRSVSELVDCYTKHNAVPELSVLLTGTALVPGDGFTLREGDRIDIGIEDIGQLTNTVTVV
ncbi:fumarylacetoacetate hydrolase family protein [Halomarina oriensis]|uniref:Fumarylacetoacetate hydrolase n=1 Tax=Halomarina oriensis TaxID=671145 RepID=A0A6B0GFI3_9EURY|nr:fumarylacetoacetate hydrolase family protein [Halomarina oriensis]MWG33464.1 fumarylacetoacetate hydrolase [Halomarina oriensis]